MLLLSRLGRVGRSPFPAVASAARAAPLPCMPLHRLTRSLCAAPAPPTGAASTPDTAVEDMMQLSMDWSRRGRRARMEAALDACRRGEPFVFPDPEARTGPGPVGAVVNLLRENGPLNFHRLHEMLEERHPGLVRSKRHLKRDILMVALVHKVMKVKSPGAEFEGAKKDAWALRDAGQVRMRMARRLGMPRRRRPGLGHPSPHFKFSYRKKHKDWRPPGMAAARDGGDGA